jgi:hypothetical protein
MLLLFSGLYVAEAAWATATGSRGGGHSYTPPPSPPTQTVNLNNPQTSPCGTNQSSLWVYALYNTKPGTPAAQLKINYASGATATVNPLVVLSTSQWYAVQTPPSTPQYQVTSASTTVTSQGTYTPVLKIKIVLCFNPHYGCPYDIHKVMGWYS